MGWEGDRVKKWVGRGSWEGERVGIEWKSGVGGGFEIDRRK